MFQFETLPFWIVAYGTAIIGWSCVGRFLLELILAPDSPNYILRWFHLLTGWAMWLTRFITPRFFHTRHLPLITAYWTFVLRFVAVTWLLMYRMVPVVAVP